MKNGVSLKSTPQVTSRLPNGHGAGGYPSVNGGVMNDGSGARLMNGGGMVNGRVPVGHLLNSATGEGGLKRSGLGGPQPLGKLPNVRPSVKWN